MNNRPLKIVIVTQGIYPALDPRSHRSTQLAMGLADIGHDVTVYALLGKYDYSELQKGRNLTFKNLGISRWGMSDSDNNSKYTILNRGLKKLFWKVCLFPDIELVPMIKRALRQEKNIDLLISIAVPYIDHFGVALCKNLKAKCWISDCGDPFTGNPFRKLPFYFKYIEKYWCKKTDYIVVPIETAKNGYFEKFRNKIKVIPQGFDFRNINLAEYKENIIPTFAYSGAVYKDLRDPSAFLRYLTALHFPFHFIVYSVGGAIFGNFSKQLGDKMEIRPYVKRDQLLHELSKVDFLININNKSGVQQPSKLIDYAMTKRPILTLTSDFNSSERKAFDEFLKRDYTHQTLVENIDDYNIENVVRKFTDIYYKKINS